VGEIKPVLDRRDPKEKVAEVHRYAETGQSVGSVAIAAVNIDGSRTAGNRTDHKPSVSVCPLTTIHKGGECVMLDPRLIISGLWVAVMLTYLWGDVLRIFAGHVTPGELLGTVPSQRMWSFIAVIMLVPIVMLVLTLTLKGPALRWANIIIPIVVILFNLAGFSGYPGTYDRILLVASFVFNGLTIWYAWNWAV
jgi:hypothetical protein